MPDDRPASIRPAELRDIRAIRTIDAHVYPTPWSQKLTIEQVTGRSRVHLVVEKDNRIIGHGGIALMDGDAHITTLAVDPAYQRRGIASSLMRDLFAAAKAKGCNAVTLEVRASNEAAIALYKRHGMTSSGIRPGYYGDNGEDAVIMWSVDFVHG